MDHFDDQSKPADGTEAQVFTKCICVRCSHEWWPRTPERPLFCAGCKVKYWWKPARVANVRPPAGPVGAPHKYPVHTLEVGQELMLPFAWLSNGQPNVKANASMHASILRYGRRAGREFRREVIGARGIRVTRLA